MAGFRGTLISYFMDMRQRPSIAQAVMEDPSFLILDESMNGLDDHNVDKMRDLFDELRQEGKTLLVASRNREDIGLLALLQFVVPVSRQDILYPVHGI